MNWNQKLNERGWKIPFLRKSLFQIGKELRPGIDAFIMRQSLVPDEAMIDKSYFPWALDLEKSWKKIRQEALNIGIDDIPSLGDISFDHGRIAADRRWKSFFLKGYGYRLGNNYRLAPVTAALIDRIPGLVTANFSVLEAGGHIPRHWGMTKGMLTYHLALKVPEAQTKCRMHLDSDTKVQTIYWEEGSSFIFDDMFNHEVWNDSDEDRYILLIQIRRPCRALGNLLQSAFIFGVRHSRFVQDIRRNLDIRTRA